MFVSWPLLLAVVLSMTACVGDRASEEHTRSQVSLTKLSLDQLGANGPELRLSGFAVSETGHVVFTTGYSEGDQVLTVIDTTGRVVSRFGERGEGPGEFRQAMFVFFRDTIINVFDLELMRISQFTLSGDYLGQVTPPRFHMPLGYYKDSLDLFNALQAEVLRSAVDGTGDPRTIVAAGDSLIRALMGRNFASLYRGTVETSSNGVILGDGITYRLWEYTGDSIRTFGRNVVPRDTSIRTIDGDLNRAYFGWNSMEVDSKGRLWVAGRDGDTGFFDVFEDYQFVQRLEADCPTNDASGLSIAGHWLAHLCLVEDLNAPVEVALRLYKIDG